MELNTSIRKNKSFKFSVYMSEQATAHCEAQGIAVNKYVEQLVWNDLVAQGVIPADVEPPKETRGGNMRRETALDMNKVKSEFVKKIQQGAEA